MLWFRRDWIRTTGRVLDSRIRTMYRARRTSIPLHNYVVEVRMPDGRTVRLEVRQTVMTVRVPVGADVPLLVRPDGAKAVFDAKDPSLNPREVVRRGQADDEERFRKLIEGGD